MEVTDSWAVEFMAAMWSQGGSLSLLLLLAVHFLWDRKSSLREPSLHFLVGKWFLTDPDRALWVINHFENHNSLGLAPSLVFSPGRPTCKICLNTVDTCLTTGQQMKNAFLEVTEKYPFSVVMISSMQMTVTTGALERACQAVYMLK